MTAIREIARAQRNYLQSCVQIIIIAIITFGLLPAVSSVSLNNSLDGSLACPGQQIRFVCLVNSSLLAWSSQQYIGPSGVRIEFSASIDNVGDTRKTMGANATLLNLHGGNMISSELRITASLTFPTASITCEDTARGETSTFEVPGAPGMPQNVRAVRASPLSSGSCVILLYWDPPNNIPVSFISHYVVDYLSQTLTTLPRFTVTALSFENCDPDTTTIKIYAIDICGRNGFSTDNTLEKVLQETGVITAIPQNESTPTSETDVNMIPVECDSLIIAAVLGSFSSSVALVVCMVISAVTVKSYIAKRRLKRILSKSEERSSSISSKDTDSVIQMQELDSVESEISDLKKKLDLVYRHLTERIKELEEMAPKSKEYKDKISELGKTLPEPERIVETYTQILNELNELKLKLKKEELYKRGTGVD